MRGRWRRTTKFLRGLASSDGSECAYLGSRSIDHRQNWRGRQCAGRLDVARRYTELIAWQLGDEIRRHVFAWTQRSRFARNYRARDQIESAIDSVCHNIAEGFSGSHLEFARYLAIARRSLNEVCDCIRSAELKTYVTQPETQLVKALVRRLYPALARLIEYLRRTPDPTPRPRIRAK